MSPNVEDRPRTSSNKCNTQQLFHVRPKVKGKPKVRDIWGISVVGFGKHLCGILGQFVGQSVVQRQNFKSDEDTETCGFQMLNDDEIVTFVHEESGPVDDETNEDEYNHNNESSKGPSNADAFSALETAMEWYEQQSECCSTQLLLLKRFRDLAAKKRRFTMVL
ncbi:uncharacterized protein TNCV_2993631 [Trichonephila clavipes]|nr:uncharacterized protein TNCV_2993631 [Trichonephila clavipes]